MVTVQLVHVELWTCQIGGLELQVDPMIDLHGDKMGIKQTTKKEPHHDTPANPGPNATKIQNPRHTADTDERYDVERNAPQPSRSVILPGVATEGFAEWVATQAAFGATIVDIDEAANG